MTVTVAKVVLVVLVCRRPRRALTAALAAALAAALTSALATALAAVRDVAYM